VICSLEEAGRYLETYKSYESKPPDLIMEKSEGTYMSQVNVGMVPTLLFVCVFTDNSYEILITVDKLQSCNI